MGLIARRPEYLPVLKAQVTTERVAAWLAHLVEGPVTRCELPGFDALNLSAKQRWTGAAWPRCEMIR
jgi:hypothetical protein